MSDSQAHPESIRTALPAAFLVTTATDDVSEFLTRRREYGRMIPWRETGMIYDVTTAHTHIHNMHK